MSYSIWATLHMSICKKKNPYPYGRALNQGYCSLITLQ